MKKSISIFLAVLLLLSIAGCGQSAGRTEAQESSPDSENTASVEQAGQTTDNTIESEEIPSAAGDTNIGEKTSSPVVYMTTDISPEGLMAIYEALGAEPDGKVAVNLSTGENGSNYLRPELIGDLVQELDATQLTADSARIRRCIISWQKTMDIRQSRMWTYRIPMVP